MKAPYLPEILRLRRPALHDGHERGSEPSSRGGKDVRAQDLVEGFQHLADAQILDVVDRAGELAPEIAQHVLPGELAVGDEVELLLEVGGEVVLDVALEEAFEEGDDEPPLVLGDQALLVDAHILALLQHGQRRGVCRRPADAELFHLLDQRRFRVARRRLGKVLLGLDRAVGDLVALVEHRQAAAGVVLVGRHVVLALGGVQALVASLLVDLEEAFELDDRAGGAQRVGLAVAALHLDVGRRLLDLGGRHLAGHGTLPDQLIQPRLVLLEVLGDVRWLARHFRGADRLVRFLGVLRLGLVFADEGGDEPLRVFARDQPADGVDRLRHDGDAVGSHVGDEADGLAADVDALIEALGDLHRLLGREAELARGVHLQRRGGKRRVRVALDALLVDRDDAEVALLDGRLDGVGLVALLDVELLEVRAVDGVEAGGELLALAGRHDGVDGPVLVGAEGLDLGLAVADEAQGDGLHASRRAGARQLAPQHRRQGEADEIVERPAREVGRDERPVDLAGLAQRGEDCLLGDGVEGDALDRACPS